MKSTLLRNARHLKNALGFFLLFLFLAPGVYAQAPSNDDCGGAILLNQGTACVNTAGTMANATASVAPLGGCAGIVKYDVWYYFIASSSNVTITLSSLGLNFVNPGIEILSGSCAGGFAAVSCISGTTLVYNTLTVGATYYVRVYSTSVGAIPTTAAGFNICLASSGALVDYGKSYVNITKGAGGGTVQAGDILEIRATFVVKANQVTVCSFKDNIPVNTTYVPGTLRILTNEGKIFRQWTDAADLDPGTIAGTAVTINMGTGATNLTGGTIKSTDKPSFFGGTCIYVASFRVKVNAVANGTKIGVGQGTISFNNGVAPVTITFPLDTIMVYANTGICSNTVGGNAILTEFGGTFGSGKAKNRVPSTSVPLNYAYALFGANMPNDYYYGVSNNTSTGGGGYTASNAWPIPDGSAPSHRVFSVWDIIGDHTGAAVPSAGNPPADTTKTSTGGYMVVINSAYRTDTAFLDTVRNLCPNTYYQYTAWFRNICSHCGCDSNGHGPTTVGYIPTAPGDTSGVHPNMTFNINGYDYYTTGDIPYTGTWVQKGLTYLTGPAETQMIISVRNNAPGGGGNDWAIDDINVATCTPNLTLLPSPNVNVCIGNVVNMSAVVTSYFANYTSWTWEKSTDNGVTWGPTGVSGTGIPVLVAGQYQYTATYPSFLSDSSTNKNMFRIKVASTISNLTNASCSFAAATTILVYVNNCGFVLSTKIKTFDGKAVNQYGSLNWTTENEVPGISYVVEKSTDGISFLPIGTLQAIADASGQGAYSFTDNQTLSGPAYYRIRLTDGTNSRYSSTVSLNSNGLPFEVRSIVNPFKDNISFEAFCPQDRKVNVSVIDAYGKLVRQQQYALGTGLNRVQLSSLGALASGMYILRVESGGTIVNRQVFKKLN
jgi:trimeric autotransporter adhesin